MMTRMINRMDIAMMIMADSTPKLQLLNLYWTEKRMATSVVNDPQKKKNSDKWRARDGAGSSINRARCARFTITPTGGGGNIIDTDGAGCNLAGELSFLRSLF